MPDAEYPYLVSFDYETFDGVAREIGLCRQERRVVCGRLLHYSNKEIGNTLGISVDTVKHYLLRARGKHAGGCAELMREFVQRMHCRRDI